MTAPPNNAEPVMKMPLSFYTNELIFLVHKMVASNMNYQAAPVTERPIQRPIPVKAQANGEVSWSNLPTLNCSPDPVKSI